MTDKTFMGKTFEEHQADIFESKEQYKQWRKQQHVSKAGFFPVFTNDFKPYLKELSGNAVRLYVYLGLHSNNETGETGRATLAAIEEFFKCDTRTAQKWLAELESFGLIKRVQPRFKAIRSILLVPYSANNYVSRKQEKEVEEVKNEKMKK